MALNKNTAGFPLIRGARAPFDPMQQKRKVYITRNCSIQGVHCPPKSVVDVSYNELQAIKGALRGEEYDPQKHQDAKPGRIEEGKLVGPAGGTAKAKADK